MPFIKSEKGASEQTDAPWAELYTLEHVVSGGLTQSFKHQLSDRRR
jgi:hypothetical protein